MRIEDRKVERSESEEKLLAHFSTFRGKFAWLNMMNEGERKKERGIEGSTVFHAPAEERRESIQDPCGSIVRR